MDAPTIIIVCSFAVAIASIAIVHFLKVSRNRKLTIMFAALVVIWAAVTFTGEFIYGAGNSTCSKLLGCVEGFGGYDAFEHFYFGLVAALSVVWLSEHFPAKSLLQDRRWKSVLTIIAMVALASVAWEMLECAHDAIRLDVLHEPILNFRLHINQLDQPSNLDTMGDLTFALLGSLIGIFLYLKKPEA